MPTDSKPVSLQPGEGVIRCPAVRSLIKNRRLEHDALQTASVQDLVRVLSGKDRDLTPNEPGSLANVAGFFAIFNHGVPQHDEGHGFKHSIHNFFDKVLDLGAAASVVDGNSTNRRFDLKLLKSQGDHPGSVDFFTNDEHGVFDVERFKNVMAKVSDGVTLNIEGIARMIISANTADAAASPVDLAKSSGEWALMVCVLRTDPATTSIPVAHLERMYSQADPEQLLAGAQKATAKEWVKVTAQISTAITKQKASTVISELHSVFESFNKLSGEKLCPCLICNPGAWV